MLLFQLSEATAAQRRVPLHLVDATDGITPETGEAAGQPQISKNGGAFANTTATLTAIGNGAYYVELTATELNTVGFIVVRYKSAATAEAQVAGQVVAFDPYAAYAVAGDAMDLVANAVDSTSMADDTITPAKFQAAAITSDVIANSAITNSKFSANAITASALAADAVAEISDGVWDEPRAGHVTAGSFGEGVATVQGNVTGSVASVTAGVTLATDAVSAAALATDAVNEIRDAILPTQNAAFNNIMFLFVAASDHVTPVTGATGTAVTRSIDGGAFGAGTGTLAEVGNGFYQYDASAADMNGGIITFRFTGTGGTPGAPDDRFVTVVTGGGV